MERKESATMFAAFKLYKKLSDKGEDCVIEKVAKEFNRQPKTIYNWSSLFDWKGRREKINAEARERALERLMEKKIEQDARVLDKLIDNLRSAEENVVGSFSGDFSVADYEKLIKLYRLLTDETTENSKAKVDYSLSEADKETLKNISKNKAAEIMKTTLDLEKK